MIDNIAALMNNMTALNNMTAKNTLASRRPVGILGGRFGIASSYFGNLFEFENAKIEQLELSEVVKDKFDAVEVAIKMIGEHNLNSSFYYPKYKGEDILRFSLIFNSVTYQHETKAPAFVWGKIGKKNDDNNEVLVINCDENFEIKYPIERLGLCLSSRDVRIDKVEIHNEKELLEVLDEILENM